MRRGGDTSTRRLGKSSQENEIWGVFIEVGGREGLSEPPEPGVFPFLCFFRRKKAATTLWMGIWEEEIGR